MERQYLTLQEAAEYLGMDRSQITRLIKRGSLTPQPNPVDGRSKILRREEVEALKAYPRPSKKTAA